MTGAVRRVQLPLEARSWAAKLSLRAWVERREWVKEWRFKVIDKVRETWTVSGNAAMSDDPEAIVSAAFGYLGNDREFADYVLDECQMDMTGEGAWVPLLKAYAWVVLQRYNRELGGDVDD